MAESLSANLQAQVRFTLSNTITGLPDSSVAPSFTKSLTYTNGVAAGMADAVYCAVRTLAASTTEGLVLSDGSLTDPLGASVDFVRVKSVFVWLLGASDTINDVTGTAASAINYKGLDTVAGFTSGTTPARRVLNAGYDLCGVTNAAGVSTALTLTVANEDASVSAKYLICVIGGKS